jgi:hypothetical protein
MGSKCPRRGPKWAQKRPKNGVFSRNFFCSKTLWEGSWVVPGPPKPNFDPVRGPKRGRLALKYPQSGPKMDKKRDFPATFFVAPKHSKRGPEWFPGPQNPNLTRFGGPRDVECPQNGFQGIKVI